MTNPIKAINDWAIKKGTDIGNRMVQNAPITNPNTIIPDDTGSESYGGYSTLDEYKLNNGIVDSTGQWDHPFDSSVKQPTNTTSSNGGSSSLDPEAVAYYQDQIDALNRLLGSSDKQLNAGLSELGNNYKSQASKLSSSRSKAMDMYNNKDIENSQDKQSGVEGVNSFVNNSYNSLMRLLSGAGAGNSSAARTVVPTLVSKSGSSRRAGVFDTAGRNARDIEMARADAIDQFNQAEEDLANWKADKEKSLRQGVANKAVELLGTKQNLELNKAKASGGKYTSGGATQDEINRRMDELDSLFGQFNPTYNAKQMNIKTPELSKFTIDPGQINTDKTLPAESSYYLPMLKKKEQLVQ